MNLELDEEQKMLRETARGFFVKECPKSLVREMTKDEKGYSPELWRKMGELGWIGLVFPQKYGGMGGSFLDLMVLVEEMGRACLPAPFLSTLLGGLITLEAGNEEQRQGLLPKMMLGELTLTLALRETSPQFDPASVSTQAVLNGSDYMIKGTKLFVENAHISDFIICVARTQSNGALGLFLINPKRPGIQCTLLKTITGDKQCEVAFGKARVPKEDVLGEPNRASGYLKMPLQKATVAGCAEMVGGAQMVLEMSVDYAKQRNQFGHPIGSFQAIQHHCTNMLIDVEGSRFTTYKAAWMLNKGLACEREVAVAKAWVSEAYQRVCFTAHEIFGGIGFTEDHDMQLYTKQMKRGQLALGHACFHHETIAQRLGL